MIGLDTNILLRMIDKGSPLQSQTVHLILKELSEGEGYICSIVFCEVIWFLRTKQKYTKEEIVILIQFYLYSREFTFEHRTLIIKALELYVRGKADFSDYLIGLINQNNGCTKTLTFDKAALNSPLLFRSPLQ